MELLEVVLGEKLRNKGWYLGLAESCTGGLIAHRITTIPGCSRYFLGGVVSYSDSVKRDVLGVKDETIVSQGAVSRQTALEMARGACRVLGVQVSVGVTGIVGPGGGTAEKPVGLTWVAVVTPERERVKHYLWSGDREANQISSAEAALTMLLEELDK